MKLCFLLSIAVIVATMDTGELVMLLITSGFGKKYVSYLNHFNFTF